MNESKNDPNNEPILNKSDKSEIKIQITNVKQFDELMMKLIFNLNVDDIIDEKDSNYHQFKSYNQEFKNFLIWNSSNQTLTLLDGAHYIYCGRKENGILKIIQRNKKPETFLELISILSQISDEKLTQTITGKLSNLIRILLQLLFLIKEKKQSPICLGYWKLTCENCLFNINRRPRMFPHCISSVIKFFPDKKSSLLSDIKPSFMLFANHYSNLMTDEDFESWCEIVQSLIDNFEELNVPEKSNEFLTSLSFDNNDHRDYLAKCFKIVGNK